MPYANRDDRIAAVRAYGKTPEGKAARGRANRAWRQRNADKVRCHNAVNKAILRGKLTPWPCEICGGKAEAHHPHYGAPMLFTWLCDEHHKAAHAITNTEPEQLR